VTAEGGPEDGAPRYYARTLPLQSGELDHERTKNLAAAAQSIVLAIAVIVGGGWTLYRYWNDDSFEAKVRGEQLEKAAFAQGNLELAMQLSDPLAQSGTYHVDGVVRMKNIGTKPVRLALDEYPIFVAHVDATALGEVSLSQASRFQLVLDPELHLSEALLRPGREIRYPFVLALLSSGCYVVSFTAPVAQSDWVDAKDETHNHFWNTSTIINLR
jgi:hypothetical protein